jgi:hypothetical protein
MFGAGFSGSTVFRSTVATAVLALLAACGGGGGGGAAPDAGPQSDAGSTDGASSSTTPGTPASASPGADVVTIAPLSSSLDAFDVHVDSTYADPHTLDALAGGPLFAAWNPTGASDVLEPGMKIMFFGHAAGCGALDAGPVVHGNDNIFALAGSRAGLAPAVAGTQRWVPAGDTPTCAAASLQDGPSMVQIDARDAGGSIGLYTDGGAQADGTAPFLAPWGAAGQDGAGANANILGSFVAFRQDWTASDPIQPWLADSAARIVSTQAVGATATGDAARPSEYVQVKQQVSVTFLNVACAKTMLSPATPCQIQYLVNTAVERTGVSDWSQVGWFNAGNVWFDPGQGGIPVVSGPIKDAGLSTYDAESGLELFRSEGNPTQHAAFSDMSFDVRIPFADLQNAARVVAGRKLGVGPADVTAAQMAAQWGAAWNEPGQWVLLSSEVGQEVYNPYPARQAFIGGSFSRLYVGPQ